MLALPVDGKGSGYEQKKGAKKLGRREREGIRRSRKKKEEAKFVVVVGVFGNADASPFFVGVSGGCCCC